MSDLTPMEEQIVGGFLSFLQAVKEALPPSGPSEPPESEPPEPEPAKTPTEVAKSKQAAFTFVAAREGGQCLFEARLGRYGAVVLVRFLYWPEAWRGKHLICRAGAWALGSFKKPMLSYCPRWLYGPGEAAYDGLVAQRSFTSAAKATKAYNGILALLNAAKALAESTLTLETE